MRPYSGRGPMTLEVVPPRARDLERAQVALADAQRSRVAPLHGGRPVGERLAVLVWSRTSASSPTACWLGGHETDRMTEAFEPEVTPATMIRMDAEDPGRHRQPVAAADLRQPAAVPRHPASRAHPRRARPDGAAPRAFGRCCRCRVATSWTNRFGQCVVLIAASHAEPQSETCDQGRSSVLGHRRFRDPVRTSAARAPQAPLDRAQTVPERPGAAHWSTSEQPELARRRPGSRRPTATSSPGTACTTPGSAAAADAAGGPPSAARKAAAGRTDGLPTAFGAPSTETLPMQHEDSELFDPDRATRRKPL